MHCIDDFASLNNNGLISVIVIVPTLMMCQIHLHCLMLYNLFLLFSTLQHLLMAAAKLHKKLMILYSMYLLVKNNDVMYVSSFLLVQTVQLLLNGYLFP